MLELPYFVVMLAPLIVGPLALAAVVVVLLAGPSGPRAPVRRLALWPIVWLAAAGLVLVHAYVWNPLAKIPGASLAEIYAALAEAGELALPLPDLPLVLCVVAAAAALPAVVRHAAAGGRLRHPLAVAVIGLAGTAAVLGIAPYTGWMISMGIADTYDVSGSDATPFASIAVSLAVVLVVAALVLAVVAAVRARPDVRRPASV